MIRQEEKSDHFKVKQLTKAAYTHYIYTLNVISLNDKGQHFENSLSTVYIYIS